MSHELSITVEADGKFFLIPSIVNGVQLSPKEAFAHAMRTKKFLGIFDSKEEANEFAGLRSMVGPIIGPRGSSKFSEVFKRVQRR